MKTKKCLLVFFMLFVFALVLIACGTKEPSRQPKLEIKTKEISILVGEQADLEFTLVDALDPVGFSCTPQDVIEIAPKNESAFTVKGLKEGEVNVKITCGDLYATVTVTVIKNTVVVTFKDGNKVLSTQEIAKGASATAPSDPVKEGYEFVGWDKSFDNVTEDLVVTAKFEQLFKISYNPNGGALGEDVPTTYKKGDSFDLPIPGKAQTNFLGWSSTKDGTDYIKKISPDTEGDLTLYANYEEATNFKVNFDFNGGNSSDQYLQDTSDALSLTIDNYNGVKGSYWGGAYANYLFITNQSSDPAATFSDRIYIGQNTETGLYEIMSILVSGASSWPKGANYVIVFSSSYKNHAPNHEIVMQLEVGDIVVFDDDFTTAITKTGTKTVKAYFFKGDAKTQTLQQELKVKSKMPSPARLGYTFDGWYDANGVKIESSEDLYNNATLKANWIEKTPVTSIELNNIPEEMICGEVFQINAKVKPSDAYFQNVYFQTANKDIVSVDANGKLVANSCGEVVITIYDYMKKAPVIKTIKVYPVDSIDISFSDDYNGVLNVNDTLQLTPKAFGKDVSGIKFTYKSSDESVLSVSADGLVKALKEGVATIIITDNAGTAHTLEIGVTVNALPVATKLDQVLALIANNNFAVVQAGNACLYNDGTERYYKATYGSVNNFLFEDFVVNNTYLEQGRKAAQGEIDKDPSDGHFRDPADTIEFVTVHDTATLTGNVKNTASSMAVSGTSIHYTVGNNEIYSAIPEEYVAYHAGDSTGYSFSWTDTKVPATDDSQPEFTIENVEGVAYLGINGTKTSIKLPTGSNMRLTHLGPAYTVKNGTIWIAPLWYSSDYAYIGSKGGNNNSIGIEMQVNISGNMYDTWLRTAKLVADICIRNNLALSRVKQHNTWTGKNCPQCLISGGNWWDFMDMVKVNYEIMKNYSDVKIEFESNNTDILDDNGTIKAFPTVTTTVSYTVKVSLGSESKSITLYSVVPGTCTWEQWNGSYPSSQIWNNGKFDLNAK